MARNNQIESKNQQNRNKENNTKNQWDKGLVHWENQQNRKTNQKAKERIESEGTLPNSYLRGHNFPGIQTT